MDNWISDEAHDYRKEVMKKIGIGMESIDGSTTVNELYHSGVIIGLSMLGVVADSLFCLALEASRLNKTMEDIRQEVYNGSLALRNLDDRLRRQMGEDA